MVGLRGYPEATTLRRFLRRFGAAGLPAFGRVHDRSRTALRPLFAPATRAILDLDSTVLTVYGRQEKAAVGFNRKKRGRPSNLPLLDEALAKLPAAIREVRVRAGDALFDHKIVEGLEARGASYVIVARLTAPIQRRVSTLRYQRVSGTVAAAEFSCQPQGWPGPRRFVVIRRPAPE